MAEVDRYLGFQDNGIVTLRDFDAGVIETLKAVPTKENGINGYFIPYETIGVEAPPGLPGIPVVFAYPEDQFQRYKLPMIVVRRDSMEAAMQRWHPGATQFRAPAKNADPLTVGANIGYTKMNSRPQAVPYDLLYTIIIVSKYRGGGEKSNTAPIAHLNALLWHVQKIYPPYSKVYVKDSTGDYRSYSVFVDNITSSDESIAVADRVVGFEMPIRIEGELDLNDAYSHETVRNLDITYTNKDSGEEFE